MDVSERQLLLGRFWMKYLRLTRAGVGTLRSLEVIQEEEPTPAFHAVIGALREQILEGSLLSEGMARHPEFFSLAARELIHTAEHNGQWDLVVEELAKGLLEGTFD
jgi:type IV pilus assembly protein PilC